MSHLSQPSDVVFLSFFFPECLNDLRLVMLFLFFSFFPECLICLRLIMLFSFLSSFSRISQWSQPSHQHVDFQFCLIYLSWMSLVK
jgi:hypothetical protein